MQGYLPSKPVRLRYRQSYGANVDAPLLQPELRCRAIPQSERV